MKNFAFTLIVLCLAASLGCGRKNSSSATPFSLNSADITASSNGQGLTIVRADENSGPTYTLTGADLKDVTAIDKKLICGPVTLPSRTALTDDPSFLTFKISEVEFHGLNKLPATPQCILQVTATNTSGSTFTKNTPISLNFDSHPAMMINRLHAERGYNPLVGGIETPVEEYEIHNSQNYPITFIYHGNSFLGEGMCLWFKKNNPGSFPPAIQLRPALPQMIHGERIEINPRNTPMTGNLDTGIQFTVAAGAVVTFSTFSELSAECLVDKAGPVQTNFIYDLRQMGISLTEQGGFVPADSDLIRPLSVTLTSDKAFPGTHHDDAAKEIIFNFSTH